MRRIVAGCLAALVCWGVVPRPAVATVAPLSADADSIRVLVVYYSMSGTTRAMAEAAAEGAARVPGATVSLKAVDEVGRDDLEAADALLIGSPTYWGTIAAPVKQFIDDWFFEYRVFLGDKVGGAFATGGGDGGGKGLVVLSILTAMLNNGMVVAGPHYSDGEARFGGFGAGATTGPDSPGLDEAELTRARMLGQRVATVAERYR